MKIPASRAEYQLKSQAHPRDVTFWQSKPASRVQAVPVLPLGMTNAPLLCSRAIWMDYIVYVSNWRTAIATRTVLYILPGARHWDLGATWPLCRALD